jgi:hypothetical protein
LALLNPTPEELLVDGQGRPYFAWDVEMTLDELRLRLDDADATIAGYFHAKLMRQAKPDDVFQLTSARRVRELWPQIVGHLGRTREFWTWLFEQWERDGDGWG